MESRSWRPRGRSSLPRMRSSAPRRWRSQTGRRGHDGNRASALPSGDPSTCGPSGACSASAACRASVFRGRTRLDAGRQSEASRRRAGANAGRFAAAGASATADDPQPIFPQCRFDVPSARRGASADSGRQAGGSCACARLGRGDEGSRTGCLRAPRPRPSVGSQGRRGEAYRRTSLSCERRGHRRGNPSGESRRPGARQRRAPAGERGFGGGPIAADRGACVAGRRGAVPAAGRAAIAARAERDPSGSNAGASFRRGLVRPGPRPSPSERRPSKQRAVVRTCSRHSASSRRRAGAGQGPLEAERKPDGPGARARCRRTRGPCSQRQRRRAAFAVAGAAGWSTDGVAADRPASAHCRSAAERGHPARNPRASVLRGARQRDRCRPLAGRARGRIHDDAGAGRQAVARHPGGEFADSGRHRSGARRHRRAAGGDRSAARLSHHSADGFIRWDQRAGLLDRRGRRRRQAAGEGRRSKRSARRSARRVSFLAGRWPSLDRWPVSAR